MTPYNRQNSCGTPWFIWAAQPWGNSCVYLSAHQKSKTNLEDYRHVQKMPIWFSTSLPRSQILSHNQKKKNSPDLFQPQSPKNISGLEAIEKHRKYFRLWRKINKMYNKHKYIKQIYYYSIILFPLRADFLNNLRGSLSSNSKTVFI